MLSTVALVVAGLSTANKIGLATVGFLFVAFALISSFVLPRRNPDFPGKHLGWFVVVCVVFFVAMISAVIYFDREPSEAAGAGATTSTTTTTTTPHDDGRGDNGSGSDDHCPDDDRDGKPG